MIFCFSACGNTALVAHRLAGILGEKVTMITNNAPRSYDVDTHRRVIWAFPVYSWGLPREVRDYIRTVRIIGGETKDHFMVATCGDDAGLADKIWAKSIAGRGWRPIAAHTVIMPNTYVNLPGFDVDKVTLANEKLSEAPERIEEIAHASSPKPFKAEAHCIGCGKCSRSCPMGNIAIVNSIPQWGNNCTMCMACYHHCPYHAVAYGKITRKKGQYLAPDKF